MILIIKVTLAVVRECNFSELVPKISFPSNPRRFEPVDLYLIICFRLVRAAKVVQTFDGSLLVQALEIQLPSCSCPHTLLFLFTHPPPLN